MADTRRALICGVSGQDGAYLARFLLEKGYQVWGSSRDAEAVDLGNLSRLGCSGQAVMVSMCPWQAESVLDTLASIRPDELYYLAGQSSVGLSFEMPLETMQGITIGLLNVLEGVRRLGLSTRVFNAGSSECFGLVTGRAADESTPFQPSNPYAIAKSAAHHLVLAYRNNHRVFACTGHFFNHESPLRSEAFVSRKITSAMARIRLGLQDCLILGNLDAKRDWGHARDYVEVPWLMLHQDVPDDFVIASGEQHTVREFVSVAAQALGMDLTWEGRGLEEKALLRYAALEPHMATGQCERPVVVVDSRYYRPADVSAMIGNPGKAKSRLGWTARTGFAALVSEMAIEDLALIQREKHISIADEVPGQAAFVLRSGADKTNL